jgi:hypothetical protein
VASRFRGELGVIVGWLVFPLIPVILADIYYQICTNPFSTARFGPDPLDWGWITWVVMLGPLMGYGFLAGATVELPDDLGQARRGWRGLLARRSVWVAVGPWCGFVVLALLFLSFRFIETQFPGLINPSVPQSWRGTWFETIIFWFLDALFIGTLAYSWLWPAWSALRRAAAIGRSNRALYRGLAVALAFVGSLFGSFWAATSWWRSFFFDPRFPVLIAVIALSMTSGCDAPITYGELRRRELFHALLVAWVLGLALMWRWWSRRRPPSGDVHDPT